MAARTSSTISWNQRSSVSSTTSDFSVISYPMSPVFVEPDSDDDEIVFSPSSRAPSVSPLSVRAASTVSFSDATADEDFILITSPRIRTTRVTSAETPSVEPQQPATGDAHRSNRLESPQPPQTPTQQRTIQTLSTSSSPTQHKHCSVTVKLPKPKPAVVKSKPAVAKPKPKPAVAKVEAPVPPPPAAPAKSASRRKRRSGRNTKASKSAKAAPTKPTSAVAAYPSPSPSPSPTPSPPTPTPQQGVITRPISINKSRSAATPTTTAAGFGTRGVVVEDEDDEDILYQAAVNFVSKYLEDPAESDAKRLPLLQAMLVELGICSPSGPLPQSIRSARAMLKSEALVNVRDYVKERGCGREAISRIIFASKSKLIKDLRSRRVPIQWIKEHGLTMFLKHF
ncbi:hypothetical protein BKA62DRAFT_670012 [Auriculariales sp. MPI-PUGE-AT-0066]|nr:hypothetical protein BKA62DRAFT_670012 [Auriculariales sp. MPI-PUGE-AT-0066]